MIHFVSASVAVSTYRNRRCDSGSGPIKSMWQRSVGHLKVGDGGRRLLLQNGCYLFGVHFVSVSADEYAEVFHSVLAEDAFCQFQCEVVRLDDAKEFVDLLEVTWYALGA